LCLLLTPFLSLFSSLVSVRVCVATAFNWTGQQHIKLDMKALEEACAVLRTSTDFKPFAKGGGKVHDYICHVSDAYWTEATVDTGDVRGPLRTLTFHISSNRFLRNMVRCIVGTLLRIGQGKMSVLELQRVCNGAQGAVQVSHNKVPACGLYLCGVLYPQNIRASSSPAH
jgi:tRNA pseudouridine38-40 synthase